MSAQLHPRDLAAALTEHWSPRVVAEVDDMYVKVAKLLGTFGWHAHADEDELFMVLRGRLRIEMEDRTVALGEGELFVVPKGVKHNPVAEEECHVMLFERKATLHTGDTITERTRSIADQLRPLALIGAVLLGACASSPRVAPSADSAFATLQQRGAVAMGVDQYTSTHIFESLPDGGRIVLQRDSVDAVGTASIRAHLRDIATRFTAGDFTIPGMVHAMAEVPGTKVMAAQRARIRYLVDTLPRGGQVRIVTTDSLAIAAVHEFLAFQRMDHRAAGHGH